MAGIGDSWGTKQELLHPRGPNGRWIKKAGVAKGIVQAVLSFLASFRPRTFQNKNQSTQYLHNISRRQGRKRMSNGDLRRLHDLPNVNEDLQDGVIDNPSTQQFVDMMDRTETELPDDLIVTTILPTEAFGFSAQTATGTDADTDPGIRGVSGKLGADRGYMPMVIGNADDSVPVPAGSVRLIIAAKKGTKVNIPGGSSSDPTLFMTRGQPFRITKIKPDGAGGWHMYASIDEARTPGEIPSPVGGPRGLQRPPTSEREAAIRDLGRIQGAREGRPDEAAEQADIEARAAKAKANAAETPVPSPAQEAERRRVEALPRQPAPGEPPPRTEPVVGRVGEPGAPGAQAPAPTVPEAPAVPRRSVDLRLAVRDAKVPSPSTGPRRKAWNEAYLGVSNGKKDPIDAVRELDADIATLRRGEEIGRGEDRGGSDATRESDTDALQQLRDVIAKEYGLEPSPKDTGPRTQAGLPKAERPEPVTTKLSKREQEAEERNRAAGASEAVPAPTPVKKAPAKKATKKAAAGPVRTKDQEDRILSQASKLSGPPRNDEERRILDEAAEISTRRQGGITARRQAGTSTEQESPAKALGPGDDIDKMTKQQMLDELQRRGVTTRKSWNKEKLEKLLRGEDAQGLKTGETPFGEAPRLKTGTKAPVRKVEDLTPEEQEQRRREAEGLQRQAEAEQGPDLDKMTKPELLAEAERRGLTARQSYTKDRIKRIIQEGPELEAARRARMPSKGTSAPAKKAARGPLGVPNSDTVRQDLVGMPADDRFPYLEDLLTPLNLTQSRRVAKDLGVRSAGRSEKPEIIAKIVQYFEGAGDVEAVARLEGPPAPVKKAAKAAVPGAAPGTAAGKITAGRLTPGMRILVSANGGHTDRKTGAKVATITSIDRFSRGGRTRSQTRIQINAVDEDGRPFIVGQGDAVMRTDRTGFSPSQTFMAAPEPGAAPTKKAAPPEVRIPAPSPVERIGPQTIKVGDTIFTGRDGGVPVARMRPDASERRVSRIARSGSGRYEFYDDDDKLIQSANPNTKMNVRRGGQAPDTPDKVQVARARQEEIFDRKRYSDTAAELDQLIADDASDKTILSRFDNTTRNEGLQGGPMDTVRARLEAGDRDGARREMRRILEANGVQATGNAGDIVPFNRREHAEIAGTSIADGDMVRIVRPGHRTRIRDEDIDLGRSVVEPATPAEVVKTEKAKVLVPEGSVPGPRTDTPVDNAPRKRELRQAWIAAEIQPPSGPVRTQTEEIRDKLFNGDITPEEAIRMMESEIELNKEDLAEIDAHLREADLTDAEKREFQGRAAKLMQGIEAQEKASTFMRMYFKDEAPVVSLKEAKEADPVSYEFLKDATPDDMREAAKEAGLDAPSGDTTDEMFTDLLKQVARNELARRAAKKAAKKAAPAKVAKKAAPEVPRDKERVDARLLAEGIDGLDDDTIAEIQRAFDGDPVPGSSKNPTPSRIAEWLDFKARGIESTTVIQHGNWGDPHADNPEREAERQRTYDLGMARARAIQELAGRVRGVRRKPVKKAAPATPEVAKLQDKVDDLEKRRIDDALGELSQSGDNRDRADAVLEGLTLPELRRLAEQSGVPSARTKRGLRDNILDRFTPRPKVTADDLYELPSRDAGREALAPLNKAELMAIAEEIKLPRYKGKSMERLRLEILEGTTGARLDSIATRGFTGPRPEMPDAPRRKSLSRRATEAGITHPGETFSDVDSAVGEADRRLQGGESPTTVSRFLRERAARVAKADINEEGRRFPTNKDKDSLLSIRKSNAEYLRRVATHVQQEGKATKATPAKKAAPVPERPGGPDVTGRLTPAEQGRRAHRTAFEQAREGEVKKLRDRARVTRELAGMRQANNPPGSFHHNKGLQDEKEADRLDAEADALERGSTPAPAKKAPAKKAAAPSPSRTGTSPVGGTKSTKPILENSWGGRVTDVHFHNDGIIGQELREMGDDRSMDVDGEPLANVVGKLATDAVMGRISQDQLIQHLKALAERLPEGSTGRRRVESMAKQLDAPQRAPLDLPDGTPGPITSLMRKLSEIPLARGTDKMRQRRDTNEMDTLRDLAAQAQERYPGNEMRQANWLSDQLRQKVLNHRHESEEGKFQIDRAVREAMEELERIVERLRKGASATPAAKKATPRLTAIPGGGSGGGTKKRPKLTVVRNENGEFSFIWGEGDDDHVRLQQRAQQPSDSYAGSTV